MKIESFEELEAYQLAFALQQRIFVETRAWPREEAYSLTDQIRRSSRSVGANISEAWAKRRYPAHFLSKLTDADGELQETRHWLASANACAYIEVSIYDELKQDAERVGRKLGGMMAKHASFCRI